MVLDLNKNHKPVLATESPATGTPPTGELFRRKIWSTKGLNVSYARQHILMLS